MAFFGQLSEGVGIQSLMTFTVGFIPLLIFLASFVNKESEWKITRFDLMCGALSLIGIICWYITQEGVVAIIFGILADALAAVPTIIKSYHYPETESGWPYLTASVNSTFTMLTIDTWDFATTAFPAYIFLVSFLLFVLIHFEVKKRLAPVLVK